MKFMCEEKNTKVNRKRKTLSNTCFYVLYDMQLTFTM